MFWYILALISLIALIVGIVVACKSYEYDGIGICSAVIGGIALFFFVFLIPSIVYNDKQSVNQFAKQKAYIENHVVNDSIENAALTTKKIELNSWLINAQYAKENYSFFTFLPDEVMELTPID